MRLREILSVDDNGIGQLYVGEISLVYSLTPALVFQEDRIPYRHKLKSMIDDARIDNKDVFYLVRENKNPYSKNPRYNILVYVGK